MTIQAKINDLLYNCGLQKLGMLGGTILYPFLSMTSDFKEIIFYTPICVYSHYASYRQCCRTLEHTMKSEQLIKPNQTINISLTNKIIITDTNNSNVENDKTITYPEELQAEIEKIALKRSLIFRSVLTTTIVALYGSQLVGFDNINILLIPQTLFVMNVPIYLYWPHVENETIKNLINKNNVNTNNNKYCYFDFLTQLKFTNNKYGLYRRISLM